MRNLERAEIETEIYRTNVKILSGEGWVGRIEEIWTDIYALLIIFIK